MKQWTIPLLIVLLSACEHQSLQQVPAISENQTSASAIQGVTLIEVVQEQPGKTLIPYRKYQLDNGLILILHEDHSDPLVHVDVTYHVGSAREELGKSGFAHFFEHMMFQGSEHVADEQHIKIVTESGGSMNGTTNADRTNYYETVPANQLEKMLWLESDRMGYLLNAVTQEKFEVQRETVKNERGQRIDNRPYGRLNEKVSEALYPEGHPYSWPVIGYMEDLNRVNVNDLKAFFLRWYGPNNATVTIGGDIEIEATLALVKKYFAEIPRGPEVVMPQKTAVTLQQDRYLSMQDNVSHPLIYMSLPTVSGRHIDEAPLDILVSILGGGKTSLFYKNLVKTQYALQASVNHPCAELACSFHLFALPNPASGKSLADLEKIIRDTLDEFALRGVEEDDLIQAKAKMEASFVFSLQSVAGKVSQLAANQTFTGTPNYIEEDIKRYANVTSQDVMRVFEKYIRNKPAVIMSIVPNGHPEMVAAKDNFVSPKPNFANVSNTTAEQLQFRQAKKSFNRNIMPETTANKPVNVPQMWRSRLTNGIQLLGATSHETPATAFLLRIPAGHFYQSQQQAGLSSLLAQMLSESTTKRSAENMSKALELLGSSVNVTAEDEFINFYVNTLSKHFDETLALVKEKIMHPAFDPEEFSRVKNSAIEGVKNNKKDASYLASTAFKQLLQGNSIAAMPIDGTEKTLNDLSLQQVKSFYQSNVTPQSAQLIIVSDLAEKSLKKSLSLLNDWHGKSIQLDFRIDESQAKNNVVYLVHKGDAAQSAIRIGKRALKFDSSGEFYKLNLMNFPLGGAFNSRINLNLREEKGYTYGAGTTFEGDKYSGYYLAYAEVRSDVTDKAIVEFVQEINNYAANGITDAEINFMRNAINQRDALKYETPSAKLGFLAQILEYDLPDDFVTKRSEIVDSITQKEINRLAKKHLNLEEMLIVVVGDSVVLKPQLEALGYQVINYEI